jgi:hypothetical protein
MSSGSDSIPLKKKCFDIDLQSAKFMSLKSILALFMLFLFVVSDIYTNSILCNFKGALQERNPTNFGIIIQGVSLVILFILANYLIASQIV